MIAKRLTIALLALLLTGCSAALLEDVGEVGELAAPRFCSEPTRLFNTFTMRAVRTDWKGNDRGATVTLDLDFTNDKSFPVALSNSGNGVLYAVQFSLLGEKSGSHAPKEASGVALVREPRKFTEPPKPGPFGYTTPPPKPDEPADTTRDVNFRIKPGEPEDARLSFLVPRGNYLLTIERKFSGKPVAGQPNGNIAVCKVSGAESNAPKR